MKKITTLLFALIVAGITVSAQPMPEYSKAGYFDVPNCGRITADFNVGWRFIKGDVPGASAFDFDDSKWALINCPHGLEYNPSECSGSSNYQGPAWYRKHFTVPEELAGKELSVHFEAVMGKSKVWLNGHLLAEHYGGYLPFEVKLNAYLKEGDNVLAVWADNSDDPTFPPGKEQTRLDFAYFGGIYRDVWLVATNKVFITNPNGVDKVAGGGVFLHSDVVSAREATLLAKLDIQNNNNRTQKIQAELKVLSPTGEEVAVSTRNITAKAGRSVQPEFSISINNPKLWAPWSPELYRVEVRLSDDLGNLLDGVALKTGLRKIEFRGRDGLYLNGKPYPGKLIGANRHQDHAYVGNALPNSGQWRDALLLKNAGCDIIRAAHYPADPAFMDACDALGMFFIVATPGWHHYKEGIFEERVFSDIRQMVRRDRNHPAVIMWESILNETPYPANFAKRTHELVHEEYPYPGAFTVCDKRADGQEYFDVVYANKENIDYMNEERCYFQREWGDNVDDFNAQNSTSRVARSWGERPMLVQAKRYAQGDFKNFTTINSIYQEPRQFVGGTLWCGFDHQRGYAVDPFYGGLTDVFRQPKYSYELFRSMREPLQGYEPMIYIAHEMTPFSEPDVTVFTNCEEVRLTVYEGEKIIQKKANPKQYLRAPNPNGRGNTRREVTKLAMPHPYVTFENVFEFMDLKSLHRGGKKYHASLVAEGLIDGKVVAKDIRFSGKRPTAIQLSLANLGIPLTANGSDFVTVIASIVDEKGNVKRLNENEVRFEVSGEGALIGDESIGANPRRVSWGTAPALIRSTTRAGKIKVKASLVAKGLNSPESAELVFESVPETTPMIFKEVGREGDAPAISIKTESTLEQLKKENEKLKRELLQLQLKEVERSQIDQDENR